MKVVRVNESAWSVIDWSGEELSTHATEEEAQAFCNFIKRSKVKDYVSVISYRYFKQGDKKKFSQSTFNKEIEAALHYGSVLACQRLLNSRVESMDELVGEAQITLKDSYMTYKKVLGLKIPSLNVEDILSRMDREI